MIYLKFLSRLAIPIWLSAGGAIGQNIQFDGSLGDPGSNGANATSLTGPNYQIDKIDGQLEGSNLFHSFEAFGLINGDTATFESTGVNNILTRVTGGALSSIDGGIVAGANLFFMNPSGILFGPNSSLNVSGAFTVTTADRINFQGGGTFAATASDLPATVTGDVTSFGFMEQDSAITLNGTNWSTSSADSVHLLGGTVNLTDSHISPSSGRITLVATPSGSTVIQNVLDPLSLPTIDVPLPDTSSVILGGNAGSSLSSNGGSNVVIRGGTLTVGAGSRISSTDSATSRGGDIDILSNGAVNISGEVTSAANSGNGGGNIDIHSNAGISVTGGRIASTVGPGSLGPGGATTLQAGGDIALRAEGANPAILESATNSPIQPAGSISVSAGRNLSIIGATVTSSSISGTAADTSLNALGNLETGAVFAPSGAILIPTNIVSQSAGIGNGGAITLSGTHIAVRNGSYITATGPIGGQISLLAANGAQIAAGAIMDAGGQTGGSISVHGGVGDVFVAGQLQAIGTDGDGGDIRLETTKDLELAPSARINASGALNGGKVFVGGGRTGKDPNLTNARNVTVAPGSLITANGSAGDGGNVILWADGAMDFQGSIENTGSTAGGFAEVSGLESLNFGGQVDTGGGELLLDPYNYTIGATQAANIVTALENGSVTITTSGNVPGYGSSGNTMDVGDITVASQITSEAANQLNFVAANNINFNANVENRGGLDITATGKVDIGLNVSLSTDPGFSDNSNAGSITIRANEVSLGEGGKIDLSASKFGDISTTANAGDLLIDTSRLTLNGDIFTDTHNMGNGGDVTLTLRENGPSPGIASSATIAGNIDTKSQGLSTGDAGDVSIIGNNGAVTLQGLISTNSLSNGDSGSVVINIDSLQMNSGRIRTSSTSLSQDDGQAGNVGITAKTITIDGGGWIDTTVTSSGAGNVDIRTNNLTIENYAEIVSTTLNYSGSAGDITISGLAGPGSLAEKVSIKNNGKISATTNTTGNAGSISIEAVALEVLADSEITSQSQGGAIIGETTGSAGTIDIRARNSTVNGTISTSAVDDPDDGRFEIISAGGNAGAIYFREGDSLTVGSTGRIESKTDTNGNAAPITIDAKTVTVNAGEMRSDDRYGGVISTETTGINTLNAGDASNISITAETKLTIDGKITSTTDVEGNAGKIDITVGELQLGAFAEATGNGQILSESTGSHRHINAGNAGMILIESDTTNLSGKVSTSTNASGLAGDIEIRGGDLNQFAGSKIQSTTTASGNAGRVSIVAETFNADGNTSTSTTGSGNAGQIDIETNELFVEGGTTGNGTIESETLGTGNAGDITIETNQLTMSVGGTILSQSRHPEGEMDFSLSGGDAGLIVIRGNQAVGPDLPTSTVNIIDIQEGIISSQTQTNGKAGSIKINANSLSVGAQSFILSNSEGLSVGNNEVAGDSGQITINADNLNHYGSISTLTTSTGIGGQIDLIVTDTLTTFANSTIDSNSTGVALASGDLGGRAGIITINSSALNHSGIIGTSTATSGDAGAILINANEILVSGGGIESDTFGTGSAGSISIDTGSLTMTDDGVILTQSRHTNGVSFEDSGGDAGQIGITASLAKGSGLIDIHDGFISSQSVTDGIAGSVGLTANTLTIGETSSVLSNSEAIFLGHNERAGDSGQITINAVDLNHSGQISTLTTATGVGGQIELNITNSLNAFADSKIDSNSTGTKLRVGEVGGSAGLIRINAANAAIEGNVTTKTQTSGNAGSITFAANSLAISESGKIESNATVSSTGNAGNITVNAGIGSVRGAIDSRSDGTGNAGIVNFTGDQLTIAGDGFVTSQTSGSGDAGAVNVIGNQIILCDNAFATSQTSGTGQAGIVTIQTDDLTLKDGAFLTTLTSGSGNAGTIALDIDNLTLEGTSSITSTTSGSGNAGSLRMNLNKLTLRDGGSVSATSSGSGKGGNVEISANEIVVDGGVIEAQAQSDGAAGSIDLNAAIVSLSNGGRISATTSGAGQGGSVTVKSQSIDVGSNGQITAETTGPGNAGTLQVTTNNLKVHGQGAISTTTTGSGKGGSVDVQSQAVEVSDRGKITAETSGSGNAGTLTVDSTSLEVHNFGEISATTSGSGRGGGVAVKSNTIAVNTNGRIAAESTGRGNAGTLQVDANTLQVLNGGEISATTTSSGQGGSVIVQTAGNTSLANGGRIEAETRGSGNAGSVNLTAQNLFLNSGSKVSATTFGSGNSGNVTVTGRDRVMINGGAGIEAVSQGTGNAGSIGLNANRITMDGGGNVSATTLQSGQGGSVQVGANLVTMKGNGSGIFAQTAGSGRAGNIDVRSTTDLNMSNGGSISGTTSGSGRAGDIKATAYDVNISGNGSGIFAETTGSGNAGSIDLNVTGANTLRLSNNGTISSRSSGTGNAGSIDVDSAGLIVLTSGSSINVESLLTNAGSIFLDGGSNFIMEDSSVTARAGQNAGNIEIRVPDTILLNNSAIIAEAGQDGGNIIIDDAQFLLLNNSILSANAILGTGGFIQIGTDVLLENNSDITASSEFGADGEVRIDALSDLSAAQAALDAALLDSSNDLQERCTIKLPGQRNSFILVGRGGLPVMPGRFLPGHQLLKLPQSD